MSMDERAEYADWAPLAEGIAETVSEAVSDGFRSMCAPLC